MLKYFLLILLFPLTLFSQSVDDHIQTLYGECELKNQLSYKVFFKAMIGYYTLRYDKKIGGDKLVVVDFRQSSTEERFYVIDLTYKKLLYKTLVAHGRNSGKNYTIDFSNKKGSYKSSLGFYVTTTTYNGSNGLSLYLNGIDGEYNTNVKERRIVVHGAHYIKENEMGHSQGCFALSMDEVKLIIPIIKNGNCIFAYASEYQSNHLDKKKAIKYYEQIKLVEDLQELLESN